MQPFTARAERIAALTSYERAYELARDPELLVSMARSHVHLGDAAKAEQLLSTLPPAVSDQANAADLKARMADATGRHDEAIGILRGKDEARPARPDELMASQPTSELTGRERNWGVDFLQAEGGDCGDSTTHDRGFLPVSRGDRSTSRIESRHLILASRWDDSFNGCSDSFDEDGWCELAAMQGDLSLMGDTANDLEQDLWRQRGGLEEAEQQVRGWRRAWPDSPLAAERLAEILMLREKWDEAASVSAAAYDLYLAARADRDPGDVYEDDPVDDNLDTMTGPSWVLLRHAVAERQRGDFTRARDQLTALTATSSEPLVLMYAYQELAATAYEAGDLEGALAASGRSLDAGREFEATNEPVIRGVQAQVGSRSARALGRPSEAVELAEVAVDVDPHNPLFQETLAEALRAVSPAAAIDAYRAAVDDEPSLFSAWNNLGVLLAQSDQAAEARQAFGQALVLRPDYPTALFNVGVLEARSGGLSGVLRSQGALAQAIDLDGGLRSQDATLRFDDEVYDSGVDLSRPVTSDWGLTDTSRTRPTALGIGLVLMVVWRVGWTMASEWTVGRGVQRLLDAGARRRGFLGWAFTTEPSGFWTGPVSVAALLFLSGATGVGELAVGAAVLTAMLALQALAPRFTRGGADVRQHSFVPASILTLLLAVPGGGFAPPAPLGRTPRELPVATRRAGVAALASTCAAFCAVAVLTEVPLARALAVATLVVLTSALAPVEPLDGARLSLSRVRELMLSGALAAGTVAFAVGVI